MGRRLTGRDFRTTKEFAKYWDSLSDDEYEDFKKEYYRKSPNAKDCGFEQSALEMDQDKDQKTRRAFKVFEIIYGSGWYIPFHIRVERWLRDTEPDMLTIHDIICGWLFLECPEESLQDDGPSQLEIGKRRGPKRYRVAPRVQKMRKWSEDEVMSALEQLHGEGSPSHHQSHTSRGTRAGGVDSLADDLRGFGIGDSSRAGHGRSNHRGANNAGIGPSRPRHGGYSGAGMGPSHSGHHSGHHGSGPGQFPRREPPSRKTHQSQHSVHHPQAPMPSGCGGASRSYRHQSRFQGEDEDESYY